jgi:EAL and modified HD-GYP domain-containing signal transduction protein
MFDGRLQVHAYELLFRHGNGQPPGAVTPAASKASVLTEALTTFGLDRLVGGARASVNVSRDFVVAGAPLPVAPERLMLELSVRNGCDAKLLDALRGWRARGFQVAIDDVLRDDPALDALFASADLLKVDCVNRGPEELGQEVAKLRRHGKPLLAQRLETRREVDDCLAMGFTYFQGHFLGRPATVRARSVAPNRVALVRLLVELQSSGGDVDAIEASVRQDPGLGFRLLRCVNSAAFGLQRRVDSLREAIVYLGAGTIRNLATLLILSSASKQPRELLRMAMFRGRFCEAFAVASGEQDRSRFFTVGMLSLFGALMDTTTEQVIEDLPLAEPVVAALVRREGPAGKILAGLEALERGDWEPILALEQPASVVQSCWIESAEWVESVEAQLGT